MTDPAWHGYPQHPDAHPERPWWRLSGEGLTRSDGVELSPLTRWVGGDDYEVSWWAQPMGTVVRTTVGDCDQQHGLADLLGDALAAYDAAHPLPAPLPLCGQVWAFGDGHVSMVTDVHDGVVTWGDGAETYDWACLVSGRGAPVLVAGPCSPWAPMGGDDR